MTTEPNQGPSLDPIEPFFTFDTSEDPLVAERSRWPSAGEAIAGWRLVRVISSGLASSVYQVERDAPDAGGGSSPVDEPNPSLVPMRAALKLFDPRFMDDGAMRRFRLHATLLGQLSHPGLVRVITWGFTASGSPYLVMDLVEGMTFDEWISQRKPNAAERAGLVAMAADAIGAGHVASGLVHRDIKPSNVMVAEGQERDAPACARVIDFGVAMMVQVVDAPLQSLQTEGRVIVGTPAYMAPEQLQPGSRSVDPRADIYALGVMLFEALTGRRPVDTSSLSIVEVAREKERTRLTPSAIRRRARLTGMTITPQMASTIAAAMSPEPEDRHSDGHALARDLRRSLRGLRPLHRPVSGLKRARRFLAREPRLAITLIAALGIALASAAWISALAVQADRARRAEQAQTDRLIGMVKSWTNQGFLGAFQTPGSEAALMAVTESVIHALEEACAVRPGDIELWEQLATAYTQLASVVGTPIGRSLGDEERARVLYDKATAATERCLDLFLEQGRQDVHLARISVANCLKRRVGVTADESERRHLLDQALAITTEVHSQHPESDIVVLHHAGTLSLWALECSDDEQAVIALDRAIELIESLPEEGPRRAARAHHAMILHIDLAGKLATRAPGRAAAELAEAEAMLDARVADRILDPATPADAMFLRLRARCTMIAAQIARSQARWEEAESLAEAATAETAHLVAADPSSGPSILDHATRLREHAEIVLAGCESEIGLSQDTRAEKVARVLDRLQLAIAQVNGYRSERPRTRFEQAEIDRCVHLADRAQMALKIADPG